MFLGTYPEISLRDARTRRDEARALLAKGINPRLHREKERQAGHPSSQQLSCFALDSS